MPAAFSDPVMRAVRVLQSQAVASGKTIDALIKEKQKALDAEKAEVEKKKVADLRDRIGATLAKSGFATKQKIEILEECIKVLKGKDA